MSKKQSLDPLLDFNGIFNRRPCEEKEITFDLENGYVIILRVITVERREGEGDQKTKNYLSC
jgi:hypothetical protein